MTDLHTHTIFCDGAASPEEMAADPGIRGALWRELEPELRSADPRRREVALRALRYALSALSGDRV